LKLVHTQKTTTNKLTQLKINNKNRILVRKKSVVICSRPFVPLPLFVEKKINTVPVFLVLNTQKSLKEKRKKDLLTEDEHF